MRYELSDHRDSLYQYDTNRSVECTADYIEWISGDDLLKVEKANDKIAIPNILLQESGTISGYAVSTDDDGNATRTEISFTVIKRPKPADYVYTETEVKSIEEILDEAKAAAEEYADAARESAELAAGYYTFTETSDGFYITVKEED